MGRRSRRLHVRAVRAAAAVALGAFLYQRWQLRPVGMQRAQRAQDSTVPSPSSSPSFSSVSQSHPVELSSASNCGADVTASRSRRWSQLQRSSPQQPFDVLVVGGGLIGLYTAVDAAQRGLRVALVEAADIGTGSTTMAMPSSSPGAFPYVQRAIRQRDPAWLGVAMTVLREERTWRNTAAACVVAPDTVWQRVTKRVASAATATAAADRIEAAPTGTTLLPALHASEMAEFACAAVISTVMSLLYGPFQFHSVLSASAMRARLPALCPADGVKGGAGASPVRARGGVVTKNLRLEGSTAAVALAATAEKLGVVVCTYSPVVAITEESSAEAAVESSRSDPLAPISGHGGQERSDEKCSWWPFQRWQRGVAAPHASPSLMVATVHDALALSSPSMAAITPVSPSTHTAPRSWRSWFRGTAHPDSAGSVPLSFGASDTSTTAAAAPATPVYARAIVNCTGSSVDAVKALFDRNAQDSVPAAFAGHLAYSYLVAPLDAVHSAVPPSVVEAGHNTAGEGGAHGGSATPGVSPASPLFLSTHTAGLHFSSPRLSFASAMVLPWWDRCVLVGPSISLLTAPDAPPLPSGGVATSAAPARTTTSVNNPTEDAVTGTRSLLQSPDGYAAQRQRVVAALQGCGVMVDSSRLLSCVTQRVPFLKGPKDVPFSREVMRCGYAIHVSSLPLADASAAAPMPHETTTDTGTGAGARKHGARRDVGLLSVYGGAPVLARRVAEEAVDALVRHPALQSRPAATPLSVCRTHRLVLDVPAPLTTAAAAAGRSSAQLRLEEIVAQTYAERLTDVVARRTHVAYTSPTDALQALPTVAAVMGRVKGWSAEREAAELADARRLITSLAVRSSS